MAQRASAMSAPAFPFFLSSPFSHRRPAADTRSDFLAPGLRGRSSDPVQFVGRWPASTTRGHATVSHVATTSQPRRLTTSAHGSATCIVLLVAVGEKIWLGFAVDGRSPHLIGFGAVPSPKRTAVTPWPKRAEIGYDNLSQQIPPNANRSPGFKDVPATRVAPLQFTGTRQRPATDWKRGMNARALGSDHRTAAPTTPLQPIWSQIRSDPAAHDSPAHPHSRCNSCWRTKIAPLRPRLHQKHRRRDKGDRWIAYSPPVIFRGSSVAKVR